MIVRTSALDCLTRVAFSRQYAKRLDHLHSIRNPRGECNYDIIASCVKTICFYITHDPCRQVRRHAALSLLFAVQDRPSFVPAQIMSFGEHMMCLDWSDCSGFVNGGGGGGGGANNIRFRKKSSVNTGLVGLENDFSESSKKILIDLWSMIASSSSANDQCLRSTLLSTWCHAFKKKLSSASSTSASSCAGVDRYTHTPPKNLVRVGSVISTASKIEISVESKTDVPDPFYLHLLPPSRMNFSNPIDLSNRFENDTAQIISSTGGSTVAAAAAAVGASYYTESTTDQISVLPLSSNAHKKKTHSELTSLSPDPSNAEAKKIKMKIVFK